MRRHPWLVVSLMALFGVLVLAAFPVRAYVEQQHQRDELATKMQSLAAENERLAGLVARLQSDETIERLARERYQMVRPGEEAYAILPEAGSPSVAAPAAPIRPPAPPARSWWSRAWSKITSIV